MRAVDDRDRERDRACIWHAHVERDFTADLATAGLEGEWNALTTREVGDVVTDARSSWVRTRRIGPKNVYVKTYDYSSPGDRRRGWGRTTWLAPSRAAREFDALRWFAKAGFPAVRGLLLGEQRGRRLGILHRACIVTEAWGDGSALQILPAATTEERRELLVAIEASVAAWHEAGWRDQNLDPRNLLVKRLPQGHSAPFEIVKIDSPRHRIVGASSAPDDRLSRADWERLRRGLAAIEGLDPDAIGRLGHR